MLFLIPLNLSMGYTICNINNKLYSSCLIRFISRDLKFLATIRSTLPSSLLNISLRQTSLDLRVRSFKLPPKMLTAISTNWSQSWMETKRRKFWTFISVWVPTRSTSWRDVATTTRISVLLTIWGISLRKRRFVATRLWTIHCIRNWMCKKLIKFWGNNFRWN